jgi:hypothetical protein
MESTCVLLIFHRKFLDGEDGEGSSRHRDRGRWTFCPDCLTVYDDFGKAINVFSDEAERQLTTAASLLPAVQ